MSGTKVGLFEQKGRKAAEVFVMLGVFRDQWLHHRLYIPLIAEVSAVCNSVVCIIITREV